MDTPRWLSAAWRKAKLSRCWAGWPHTGLLKFSLVVAAVALGGMIGDQLLYFLGLRFGPTLLQRFAGIKRKFAVLSGLSSDVRLFVIGTRFMYGFRIIGPILIGASRLPPKIFLPLNILGAIAGVDFHHAWLRGWRSDWPMAA